MDQDPKPIRKLTRRSFLGRVAGGAFLAGGATLASTRASAVQISDADSGPNADPPGRGRGTSDNDPTDPIGRGRGRGTGITDNDPNDPIGNGRGGRSCSDSDRGRGADPIGRGRRC